VDHLIFLDANVLFSAAYRSDAGLRKLWRLPGVRMVTSAYAVEEARRNLSQPRQREELDELLGSVEVVPTAAPTVHPLFSSVMQLPDKDRPILLAAIGVGATHLLTGDFRHFGPYYGKRLEGVLILSSGEYLSSRTE
jgi:predicted nucleic acid-binding protein